LLVYLGNAVKCGIVYILDESQKLREGRKGNVVHIANSVANVI